MYKKTEPVVKKQIMEFSKENVVLEITANPKEAIVKYAVDIGYNYRAFEVIMNNIVNRAIFIV